LLYNGSLQRLNNLLPFGETVIDQTQARCYQPLDKTWCFLAEI
jgi:hypothetical protein